MFTIGKQPAHLRGLYAGRSAFLIGGGPSLKTIDRTPLESPGCLTMAMNNAAATVRPNLWVHCDHPRKFLPSIWLDPRVIKFVRDQHAGKAIAGSGLTARTCPGAIVYEGMLGIDPVDWLDSPTVPWGVRSGAGGTKSVMLPAMWILHYLGVRTVYLIGCDFCQTPDDAYSFQRQVSEDHAKRNTLLFAQLDRLFADMRAGFDKRKFRVLNATPDSALTAFPRIDYDEAVSAVHAEFDGINVATESADGLYDAPQRKPIPRKGKYMHDVPNNYDVCLITPTGDRHEAFALCERYIERQTFSGSVQWIVVDDGETPTTCTRGQTYIRRNRGKREPMHTLGPNMLAALDRVESHRVVIIEDDDWYAPDHVQRLVDMLANVDLAGQSPHWYAHLHGGECSHENPNHASWCMTAFSRAAFSTVRKACERPVHSIDMRVWATFSGSKAICRSGPPTCIGIKGMPGRRGPLSSHTPLDPRYSDAWTKVTEFMGADVAEYDAIRDRDRRSGRPCVYTAIIGGYDRLSPPKIYNPEWDYFVYTDREIKPPHPWQQVKMKRALADATREARRIKCLSHIACPTAPWTIWHDGNIRLMVDPASLIGKADVTAMQHPTRDTLAEELAECIRLKKDDPEVMALQVERYSADRLNDGIQMAETGLLIRRSTDRVAAFNRAWWTEISNGSKRDQLSFGVTLRQHNIEPHLIPRVPGGRPDCISIVPHGRRASTNPATPITCDAANVDYWRDRWAMMGPIRTAGDSKMTDDAFERTREEFAAIVAPKIPPFKRALDFGCGAGRWHPLLSSRGCVVGCDIVAAGYPGEFRLIENGQIPFSGPFDLIWTCVTLQHIIDPVMLKSYIRQFANLLEPGGKIIVTENVSRNRDKPHIRFRISGVYLHLLREFSPRVVGHYDFGIGEKHAIIVGRKK